MLFSRRRPDGADSAGDTLRAMWSTTATAITFAVPVDVAEDDEGFTLRFDLAGHEPGEVRVRAEGNAVWVEARAHKRTFWLAAAVEPDRVETEFGGVELKVRLIKTRVAAARKIVVRRGI